MTGCHGNNCAANSGHVDTAERTVLIRPGETCPCRVENLFTINGIQMNVDHTDCLKLNYHYFYICVCAVLGCRGAGWDVQPEKLDFSHFHRKHLRGTPKHLPHIDREGWDLAPASVPVALTLCEPWWLSVPLSLPDGSSPSGWTSLRRTTA